MSLCTRGKTKVPKDINESKVTLHIPLMPDEIVFEGRNLGWVLLLKLEDQDLADTEKFLHLVREQIRHHIVHTTTRMNTLELQKWLRGVDKAGLLNLLWVSHYNHTPIIVLVIKQLLCLVHNGCLWLEEPIPITNRLILRITWMPYTRENLAMMFGEKGGEHALAEAMKDKLKLMKKPRGYAISSIYDPMVKVATQILARKFMQKFHTDEVLTPVIAIVAQCTEFNLIGCTISMVSSSQTAARNRSSARPSTMRGSCCPLCWQPGRCLKIVNSPQSCQTCQKKGSTLRYGKPRILMASKITRYFGS